MKKINRFTLLLALLAGIGCDRDSNPVSSGQDVDSRLVGAWYRMETNTGSGQPYYYFDGIQIDPEGQVFSLGINIPVGEIAPFSPGQLQYKILYTHSGNMIAESPQRGMIPKSNFTRKYKVSDSTLTYIYENAEGQVYHEAVYKKSMIGARVTAPVISEFSVVLDNDTLSNPETWRYPAAYSGYGPPDDDNTPVFEISSRLNWYRSVRIRIKNFSGPGTYVLGPENDGMGFLEEDGGCAIGVFLTAEPNSGFVRIDAYDADQKICAGVFEFYVEDSLLQLSNGRFRIPVYNQGLGIIITN